jgi:hypothetical protein
MHYIVVHNCITLQYISFMGTTEKFPRLPILDVIGTYLERRRVPKSLRFIDCKCFKDCGGGGAGIFRRIENTEPIEKSIRSKRSRIRNCAQLGTYLERGIFSSLANFGMKFSFSDDCVIFPRDFGLLPSHNERRKSSSDVHGMYASREN